MRTAQFGVAAFQQFARRCDAHLLRHQIGALLRRGGFGVLQRHRLLADGLFQPLHELRMPAQRLDAGGQAGFGRPTGPVVGAVGQQLVGLRAQPAHGLVGAQHADHGVVTKAFGVVQHELECGVHQEASGSCQRPQLCQALGQWRAVVHVLLQQRHHVRLQLHGGVEFGVVPRRVGAQLDQVARLVHLGQQLAQALRQGDNDTQLLALLRGAVPEYTIVQSKT